MADMTVEAIQKRLEKITEALLEIAEGLPQLASGSKAKPKVSKPAAEEVEDPTEPESEGSDEGGDTGEVDLESMNRMELLPIATELGIDTKGVKAEELRELIKEMQGSGGGSKPKPTPSAKPKSGLSSKKPAGGGLSSKPKPGGLGGATPSKTSGKPKPKVNPKAEKLETFVGANYEKFAERLDTSVEEGGLGCGGTCTKCPHPECETAEEQVNHCYEAVKDDIEAEE